MKEILKAKAHITEHESKSANYIMFGDTINRNGYGVRDDLMGLCEVVDKDLEGRGHL